MTDDNPRWQQLHSLWHSAPVTVRKTIVATLGATLILLGLALVVLPGPFTLPLLVAGLAVLASEFAWAARALVKVRAGGASAARVGRGALNKLRRR